MYGMYVGVWPLSFAPVLLEVVRVSFGAIPGVEAGQGQVPGQSRERGEDQAVMTWHILSPGTIALW